MRGVNVIVVFNETGDKILMCLRRKNPYKGLSNFPGGKIEPDENGLEAAYRELWEETSISGEDINLTHLMDFTYYLSDCYLEVYVGRLKRMVNIFGDENDLYWSAIDKDFFDVTRYAGEGNIGHIMLQIKEYWEELME